MRRSRDIMSKMHRVCLPIRKRGTRTTNIRNERNICKAACIQHAHHLHHRLIWNRPVRPQENPIPLRSCEMARNLLKS